MSEPEFDIEERDRIAGMMREDLIKESAEGLADAMWDDGHKNQEALVELYRDGLIGYKWRSTRYLRDELYDINTVPKEERRYWNDDDPGPALTVGGLIDKLFDKEPWWTVMMRHNLDGDVIIGSRITEVKADGFHQQVNLIGPTSLEDKLDRPPTAEECKLLIAQYIKAYPELEKWLERTDLNPLRHKWELEEPKGVEDEPQPRCQSKDIVPWGVYPYRYRVRQCKKGPGHSGNHRYRVRDDQPAEGLATPEEAKKWLREN